MKVKLFVWSLTYLVLIVVVLLKYMFQKKEVRNELINNTSSRRGHHLA